MHRTRILRRPPINKQPSGDKRRAQNQRWQSILRLALPSVLLSQPLEDPVRAVPQRRQAHEISNPKADVRQTDSRLAEAIRLLEHERERREEQVEDAVDDGHVQRHEGADGREEHEFGRAGDGADEDFLWSEVLLEFGAEGRVGGFFAEARGFAREEHGSVGFVYGEDGGEGDDGDGDGEDPEDPAPTGVGGEETAADGTYGRIISRLFGARWPWTMIIYQGLGRRGRPLPRDSWLALSLLDA